jgi:dUTP pyrophosphatase
VSQENNVKLGFYRLSERVELPRYATEGSAAFDLKAFFDGTAIKAYSDYNEELLVDVAPDNKLFVLPGYRYIIPTGLILDIPEGYKVNVNIRGGTATKRGILLANSTGIIDSDYVNELFIVILNATKTNILIENGERLAQAMLEKVNDFCGKELDNPPQQKTTRQGGFNSTGVK